MVKSVGKRLICYCELFILSSKLIKELNKNIKIEEKQ